MHGAPLSRWQERKLNLSCVLNEGQYVSIKELKKEEIPNSSSIETQNYAETDAASVPTKRLQKQGTLTSYVGSKSKPKVTCPDTSLRKGLHVFGQHEIDKSPEMEQERKTFWNKQAEELHKENVCDKYKGDEVDKRLHERWKVHKSGLITEKYSEITNKIEQILKANPGISVSLPSSRNIKTETI